MIFRDHLSISTTLALARASRYLDQVKSEDILLIVAEVLRAPTALVKAMALEADSITVYNSAIQAMGCFGMHPCNTNNFPVGIATQKEYLKKKFNY